MTARILLIGATGVFGGRLAIHLTTFSGIELVVTSRSKARAAKLAARLNVANPDIQVKGLGFDKGADAVRQLDEIKPFIVIDCSGPFQASSHAFARTVLASGSHFVDLADARDYLANFSSELDEAATSNSVSALCGASSTPALSNAVIDNLVEDWQRVDSVEICITPAGKSEVGQSVLRAILSYAGRDIPSWDEGKLSVARGWGDAHTVIISRVGKRRVARVETYDAEFSGKRLSVTSRVTFSAGLESAIEQRGMEFLAMLVRIGVIRSIGFLAPFLLAARKVTSLGTTERGGMMVEVKGLDKNNTPVTGRWSLLAEQDHGPYVPVLPAVAVVRKLLDTEIKAGAFQAFDVLSLADIEYEMLNYSISTRTEIIVGGIGIFQDCLGIDKFGQLPQTVQAFHRSDAYPVWEGRADVSTSNNFLVSAIARILGFPKSGKNVPLCVSVDRKSGGGESGHSTEIWTRNFDGAQFYSELKYSTDGKFTETFGALNFGIGLDVIDGKLVMPVNGWRIFNIPLPSFLAPVSDAFEYADEKGRFCFDVKLTLPILGLFAHYRGWLEPKSSNISKR